MTNQKADLYMKKAPAVIGGISEDESKDQEDENQSLLVVEEEGRYDFCTLIAT